MNKAIKVVTVIAFIVLGLFIIGTIDLLIPKNKPVEKTELTTESREAYANQVKLGCTTNGGEETYCQCVAQHVSETLNEETLEYIGAHSNDNSALLNYVSPFMKACS